MRPFSFERAASLGEASEALGESGQFIAGGTTLVDLMRLEVMRPERLVDITGLAESEGLGAIEAGEEGLRLGALVSMSEAAAHPALRKDYPVLADSLELAASQQLRNMATLGGNVLQRTRCPYFRDVKWAACNKRRPGSGCAAQEGHQRLHALLGASNHCIAAYPGDFAQGLAALDAEVETMKPGGARRSFPITELHRQPGEHPDLETNLARGEIITAFRVPALPWAWRSTFVKVRDRESYAFALASAAVALDLGEDGGVREARIALGGVSTVPWRAREAEACLKGEPLDEASAGRAADLAFSEARRFDGSAFKITLGKQTLIRALLRAGEMDSR